jgi:c-di-GMP-binding flagellar brake protein YcgR
VNDRRYPRVDVKVPVYVSLDGGGFLQKTLKLESRDVSGGGLSFETRRKVPLEAESRVVVGKLGDLPPAALIRGRVAHRERDPATRRYTVGVEFTEFVNVTREELLAHIETWRQAPV